MVEKAKRKPSADEDFVKSLIKQQNDFNQLMEKALEIDVDKKFDVKKYLPKNESCSSKILRKYQGVLNRKEQGGYEAGQHYNDLSDIKQEVMMPYDNDTTFNYNFMPTQPCKKERDDDSGECDERLFAVYVEEVKDKRVEGGTSKQCLRKEKKNEIEECNDKITESYMGNNGFGSDCGSMNRDYMWYCLDYEYEGKKGERDQIEEKFLSFE